MAKRQSDAAEAASDNTVNSAAAQAAGESAPTMLENITNAAEAATNDAAQDAALPTADGTIEVSPEAAALAQIEAALQALPEGNPARAALEAARDAALGALAMAEAEAARMAEKAAEIAAATAAAAALPANLLQAMLAAIEAKYAPLPEAAPEAAVTLPRIGRKQPSARTLAFNAEAIAAADGTRSAAAYAAFRKEFAGDLIGVSAQAGTRYASIVTLAGDGVANFDDYKSLVAQVRHYLLSVGLAAGGASYASLAWLIGAGAHAAGESKDDDTLRLKFSSRAEIALCADGRFRLARPAAGVRFISRDQAALAAFMGGAATPAPAAATPAPAAATPAPAAAASAPAAAPAASAPIVPTAPAAIATPTGGIAQTARCQHCVARNIVGAPACAACGATDWLKG